jgi:hypothetical protein
LPFPFSFVACTMAVFPLRSRSLSDLISTPGQ